MRKPFTDCSLSTKLSFPQRVIFECTLLCPLKADHTVPSRSFIFLKCHHLQLLSFSFSECDLGTSRKITSPNTVLRKPDRCGKCCVRQMPSRLCQKVVPTCFTLRKMLIFRLRLRAAKPHDGAAKLPHYSSVHQHNTALQMYSADLCLCTCIAVEGMDF